ncbi:MAG: GHKL domain-containing protein [Lachnospiraceae bacterium]|nr:GHKL domain-containing protein [Lachnospiraceae bacterium]
MIPLNLLGITIEAVAVNYAVPFLFFEIITISFVILVLRKLLFNLGNFDIHEDSVNIQRSFLIQIIFGICTIFLNIIYSSSLGYPTQVQTLNGIFISFYVLSTIALFYSSFKILRRNYELTIKQNDEKYVDDYLRRMEGFYEEIRSFRHDYLNIFCTMHCHIENLSKQLPDNENMDALKDYFDKINKSGTEQINHDYFTLGQLSNIKILEIKSIFYSKLLFAMNQELHVTLEITEPLENISMDIIKLCRIIGILLDNSIEAAILAAESILHIAIINKKEDTVFEIENSMLPITIPVSELAEKGVTTKENHDGLGLHNVQKITDELSNVFFSFGYNELFFRQQLRIRKGSA